MAQLFTEALLAAGRDVAATANRKHRRIAVGPTPPPSRRCRMIRSTSPASLCVQAGSYRGRAVEVPADLLAEPSPELAAKLDALPLGPVIRHTSPITKTTPPESPG